jgi:hypothetical protein
MIQYFSFVGNYEIHGSKYYDHDIHFTLTEYLNLGAIHHGHKKNRVP